MKTLAALLACVPMSGCVIHWPPGQQHERGPLTVIVCVFANCKLPEKQETPTPLSNSLQSQNASDSKPRGSTPDAQERGARPR